NIASINNRHPKPIIDIHTQPEKRQQSKIGPRKNIPTAIIISITSLPNKPEKENPFMINLFLFDV
ncbi:MAG: hypothetical protein DRG35_07055, partial [Deltaproteobacteria bacterium]